MAASPCGWTVTCAKAVPERARTETAAAVAVAAIRETFTEEHSTVGRRRDVPRADARGHGGSAPVERAAFRRRVRRRAGARA
ncbi:hypothetical protein GCM10023329_20600 [Streptomyces sanyensis]|uniref:Uncharacterized protein n=1 Tax=Streptomyces sanyensis TaxID=568869 RepID=A0ABP9A2R2_9ACTN